MSESVNIPSSKSQPALGTESEPLLDPTQAGSEMLGAELSKQDSPSSLSSPPTPGLSRSASFSSGSNDQDEEFFPPLDRLTIFDFLENLALPQRLETIQKSLESQTQKARRHQQRLKNASMNAKERVVDEWRRRLPPPEEQLDKYRKRVRSSVDNLGKSWNESKNVTTREKISFIAGVLNVFVSGYLVGARPDLFHLWYSAQLFYFMPVRYFTYHKKGYHYFLADLCYFANLLLTLSIWVFPNSKRLFISAFCLAFGNNAVAIAMWRNSLVFHSLDKVTSLFIHIMPCVTLHCMTHLLSPEHQKTRFPAAYNIRFSDPTSPEHYSLPQMVIWSSLPYAVWQVAYHFLVTVRKREKIAKGNPTSFTWLRKSYAKTWIGKTVLSLPNALQEPAFMLIQYLYAMVTMIPCPLWFWYRYASAVFLLSVFAFSTYNGATFYIDHYGQRFSKELEQLKKDVAKWQVSPEMKTPPINPSEQDMKKPSELNLGQAATDAQKSEKDDAEKSKENVDNKANGTTEKQENENVDNKADGTAEKQEVENEKATENTGSKDDHRHVANF